VNGQPARVLAERHGPQDSRVTVALTLHNFRDFLASCLDSVAAQTLPTFDLIIVDDCSTDDGAIAANEWLDTNGARFASYLLVRNDEIRGMAAARNTAFAAAATEYVFVLDGDNVLFPRCLQQLASALDHSDASFAYCYLERFGAATGLLNTSPWQPDRLHLGNSIEGLVMLRRHVWQQAGGYSIDIPTIGWEDFDLWFKIARMKGWGVHVPEILGRRRAHMTSINRASSTTDLEHLWRYLRERHPHAFTNTAAGLNTVSALGHSRRRSAQ
jgi:glycosyltransferase involved in cell wall biosynthesis